MRAHLTSLGALALAGAINLVACNTNGLRTDRLLGMFNSGATDSFADPALKPDAIATERVVLTARRSLLRGYLTQGSTTGVASWLRNPKVRALVLEHVDKQVLALSSARKGGAAPGLLEDAPPADPAGETAGLADDTEARRFRSALFEALALPAGAACATDAPTQPGRARADAARLAAGLEIASLDVARMIVEQIVERDQAHTGLSKALDEASGYLAARRWTPSDRAPTFGVAIKGGASSGVYSAGAVWRVLTMLQHYRDWKRRRPWVSELPGQRGVAPDEARLAVASGTSAGAIIAAVVDLFHQRECVIDPEAEDFRRELGLGDAPRASGPVCEEYARRQLATLFTCVGQQTLYCVDSRPLWELAGSQQGLMDFDGLRGLIQRHVKGDALVNESELVLTTVDFRWGELFTQSDQDPSTVEPTAPGARPSPQAMLDLHRSIEASFVLPFIAWPVDRLRIGGEQRRGVYLDGGIKSEIPVLALVQRGVERALVVGSSPPRITPTEPQANAAEIAARYLDVSLSAVTEGEWNAAYPFARFVESFEEAACHQAISELPEEDRPEDCVKFCRGQLDGGCGQAAPIERRFDVLGLFRREDVDPTYGYSFDPAQMRRLFNAGTEAARERCLALATFLGMDDVRAIAPEELDAWCNETPVIEPGLCPAVDPDSEYTTCEREPRRKSRP